MNAPGTLWGFTLEIGPRLEMILLVGLGVLLLREWWVIRAIRKGR